MPPLCPLGFPQVGFGASGYMPGSACCRTISHCGRACQRALLLGGVGIDDAIRLNLVSELSKAPTIEAIDNSSILPMLMAQARTPSAARTTTRRS